MKKIYTFLLLCFVFQIQVRWTATAQNFAVKLIADSLQKDANAVVRIDEGIFTVHSPTKCIFKTRIAYTIFNEKATKYATKYVGYDKKFIFIKSLKAYLYDANGKKVRTLYEEDFKDESAISDISLHEDDRVKSGTLTYPTYPYTVEFLAEIEYKSMLYVSDWWFQGDSKMAVEKSTYQISTPTNLPIRYQEHCLTQKGTVSTENNINNYFWEQNNIKAFEVEPMSKKNSYPYLRVATQQFELDGHHVDMTTWLEFGKWRKKLCEGREELPEETKQHIRNLVQNIDKEEEKIAKIYEYMQAKTRYVSIQLGIGGFQPFPAEFVDKKGFGDCKALSNYTKSLLKAADIEAHYTLIYAGDRKVPIEPKFPDMQFNHAILCVPLTSKKDTIWLECTQQQEAAGYMAGNFTGNRQALLLTDEGGIIANTPTYTHKENLQNRHVKVDLAADGSAKAQIYNSYQAMEGEMQYWYADKSTEMQRNMVLENWELPTFELGELKIWKEKKRLPITHEQAEVTIGKLATVSGKRLFFQPNLLSKLTNFPTTAANKTQDVYITDSFTQTDSITINLPENFHVESKPEGLSYKTVFGEYETQLIVKENKMIYVRKFVYFGGTFPKEKYAELLDFHKKIIKADAAKVVFVNKT
jgi:hypothetical protein